MPGGVHIVLKATHSNGTPLVALGYRYSKKTTLFFVSHRDAGTTAPGRPYEMKYTDDYRNVQCCLVDCPELISNFFQDSNVIDMHNQVRQFELALEKKWVTTDGFFCLATTLFGIHVTDCWKLAMFHKIIRQEQMWITKFAGILAKQLIDLGRSSQLDACDADSPTNVHPRVVVAQNVSCSASSLSSDLEQQQPQQVLSDCTGIVHPQLRYKMGKKASGKNHCLTRWCRLCNELAEQERDTKLKKLTSFFCAACNKPFCCPTDRI
jgi:hypothetical protein